ncbi:MAG TPA: Uma2 family endonuclease [Thermoanaerobaculia bacterium]|jgi:Uma2 family endonuclease|nr:Uma2 family endonuclease [Thermoanaerobaculia bacterium]
MSAIPFQKEIFYPESDGEPMGETGIHVKETMYLIQALEERFRAEPDVYVCGDMFLYFVEGDPRSVVSPDVFVVKGVPKTGRRVYKFWEEGGRGPCFVIEVTSDSTRKEDLVNKKALYERLGVEEYMLYDPLGEYLTPRIQGYRLVNGRYQPIRLEPDGSLVSLSTGVTFRVEGEEIRAVETASGEPILRYAELEARRRALEDEIARFRAELERLRKTD